MILNNDRLSHWFIGALLGWAVWSLLLFIPIFHLWLRFPIAKIVVSASIGCLVQMAFTPWLFSARATPQNPTGRIAQRSAAVILWITLTALLFFYYIQRGWPNNSAAHVFRLCVFGTTIVAGVMALVRVGIITRRKSR